VNVIAAESQQEAARLATSLEQAIVQSPQRQAGAPPSAVGSPMGRRERAILDQVLACSAMGSPATVKKWLNDSAPALERTNLIIDLADLRPPARLPLL